MSGYLGWEDKSDPNYPWPSSEQGRLEVRADDAEARILADATKLEAADAEYSRRLKEIEDFVRGLRASMQSDAGRRAIDNTIDEIQGAAGSLRGEADRMRVRASEWAWEEV